MTFTTEQVPKRWSLEATVSLIDTFQLSQTIQPLLARDSSLAGAVTQIFYSAESVALII